MTTPRLLLPIPLSGAYAFYRDRQNVHGHACRPGTLQSRNQRPSESNPTALGYYLVDNLGCFHCHSKSLTTLNLINPDQTKGYLAGGIKLKGEKGTVVVASNITPDKNAGIGNYTRKQFLRALKDGEAPDRKLHPPMPRFDRLSDGEIDAIYAYLQTVPSNDHKVVRN